MAGFGPYYQFSWQAVVKFFHLAAAHILQVCTALATISTAPEDTMYLCVLSIAATTEE